ncbi:hypothetical protein DSM106972_071900 [Dulcicalothrix desertica PCC 7102]|uniref:Nucleoside phosphorylase domain-containing protein n=1 Tax=Dulcicalothrix desertica PCC 7102 TaxID=232991 RepID=A0A433V3V7_9CYAN|nr:hypothetical protein [Dulcicalothrix desertica]RUT00781.1 hypothetical protein DSM106972_071900 [Dulcicalothrix desertica PCC 7102]
MTIIAPNTKITPEYIDKNIILCCGEDANELIDSFKNLSFEGTKVHEYRCYQFWKYLNFSLIWTGIGTGTLEPLIWEILFNPTIKSKVNKIILIGTAGKLPNSSKKLGDVYIIDQAYLGATAVDDDSIKQPLTPNFLVKCDFSTASIVSTDFFYGFSERVLSGNYPNQTQRLIQAVNQYFYTTDLVDMEVAQFYHFCNLFDPEKSLNYIAIKGAANTIGNAEEQIENSSIVIQNAIERAIALL